MIAQLRHPVFGVAEIDSEILKNIPPKGKLPRLTWVDGQRCVSMLVPLQHVIHLGRPSVPWLVQLEQIFFNPITGEGEWHVYYYRAERLKDKSIKFEARLNDEYNKDGFLEWEIFENFCKTILKKLPPDRFDILMTHLSNFRVVNYDLRSHDMYAVIPRPTDDVPVPGVAELPISRDPQPDVFMGI